MHKLLYQISYYLGQVPWDTAQIPPQIVETVRELETGVALDLGCGTGTHSIYLAQQGWQVIGIDFIHKAIKSAQKKAHSVGVQVDFRYGDLTQLTPADIPPVDLVLDVMCLHALPDEHQAKMADVLAAIMSPDAIMLMSALPPHSDMGFHFGLSEAQIVEMMSPKFTIKHTEVDEGTGWYWLRKTSIE